MSLSDVLKSTKTKVGGGLVGGGGILLLALNLMNDKVDSVQKSMDSKEVAIVQMVESKHQNVLIELKHLIDQQREMKALLEKIDQRVYEINKKQLYSGIE